MPDVNMFQAMLDLEKDEGEHIMKFVTTKSSVWSFEEEQRLIFWDHPNTVVQFGPELIAEVILGCRMRDATREQVIDVCRKNLPGVRIYRAEPDARRYRLNMVPVR